MSAFDKENSAGRRFELVSFVRPVKSHLPPKHSRDEFERMSHPEKLQYLTDLLNALDASRQSASQAALAASGTAPLPRTPGREAD